jgi:GTP-binding protein
MVDGVLVLVDAYEGVMPQTKFVVKKMLALGIKPIVVINKIDKDSADPERVVDEMFDLFADMGATDEQQDFPIIYAAARDGIAKMDMSDEDGDFTCIFNAIINDVPEPEGDAANPLQAQVFTLDYDNYVGKIGISRIFNGRLKKGDAIKLAKADGEFVSGKISKLIGFLGLNRMEIQEAEAGDIVAIAGMETVDVGDTICDPVNPVALDPMHVEEPTLTVVFSVNDSPLAGQEGKHVTGNKIRERLESEMTTNVAMRMDDAGEGKYKVSGRGELQITVLAENMRREGYEFGISRPEVIVKEIEGVKCEPFEHLLIDVPEDLSGTVI